MNNKEFQQSKLEEYTANMETARESGDYAAFQKWKFEVNNMKTMIKMYEAHSDD